MNILIVVSGNYPDFSLEKNQPFVYEQVNSIKKNSNDIIIYYFFIKGKGAFGYLSNYFKLRNEIIEKKINIVHAHYSLSGLLCILQRKAPVICTFHGTDINNFILKCVSLIVSIFTAKNFFVSSELLKKSIIKKRSVIIPCGVDVNVFKPIVKTEINQTELLDSNFKHILFSSSFNNPIKNFGLLKSAVEKFKNIKIHELKGLKRNEVAILMNKVDVCVLTSFNEGSPQFIKEALACGCPIVSTNVGDVKDLIQNIEGCYICEFNPIDLSNKILESFKFDKKTIGPKIIIDNNLDINSIANKILHEYHEVLENKK
jgi:teichuronic acid biosynthesis glycosyltransferase TuaC